MKNIFSTALEKIDTILGFEKIDYMIVGGFAVSFYNRARTTNDIDLVIQIQADQIDRLLDHFPLWQGYAESFKEDVAQGMVFNIVDFETGMRYDFMPLQDTAYGEMTFSRRQEVEYLGIHCFMASKEDLILSKIRCHNISPSEKQMEDLEFLLLDEHLDKEYLITWSKHLNLDTYGLLE